MSELGLTTSSTYTIIAGGQGIQCLICLHTSYHPRDVSDRYCGQCHRFHETKISWTEQKEANEQLRLQQGVTV